MLFHYSWLLLGTLAYGAAFSFVFALLPGGIFTALRLSGAINRKVPAHGAWPEMVLSSIRVILICWVGSFIGMILALPSMIFAAKWDSYWYPDRIHDGQEGLVIIFSVPACGLLAGVLAAVGTRLFLCSSSKDLWSASWLYSGNRRIANKCAASAVLAALLISVFLCGFLLNWLLMHPGPF